jgi:hypothetical protein
LKNTINLLKQGDQMTEEEITKELQFIDEYFQNMEVDILKTLNTQKFGPWDPDVLWLRQEEMCMWLEKSFGILPNEREIDEQLISQIDTTRSEYLLDEFGMFLMGEDVMKNVSLGDIQAEYFQAANIALESMMNDEENEN